MNIERLALRRTLVAFLHDTCPALVEAMKRSRHLYPGDDSSRNAHHLEDTVWTHTLLVLQAALEREEFALADILTALVHDFGKPASQVVRPRKSGPGRRHSFSGHGPVGVQAAVDFLDALARAGVLSLPDEDIARVAFATSLHIQFYDLEDAAHALRFCNDDPTYLAAISRLLYCDLQGSVGDTNGESFGGNLRLLDSVDSLFEKLAQELPKDEPYAPFAAWDQTAGRGAQGPLAGSIHLVCGHVDKARRRIASSLARDCLLVHHAAPENEDYARCGSGDETFELSESIVERTLCETPRKLAQETVFQEARDRLAEGLRTGIVVEGSLCTRKERRSLAGFLRLLFPEAVIACTYVLSRKHDLLDPNIEPSAASGLVEPCPAQVLPCLHHETNLAAARIVHVRPAER